MSQKRKISFRKIIQTLLTFVVVAGCVVAITSADRRQNTETIKSVRINIRNEKTLHFIDKKAVTDLLFTNRHLDINSTPIHKLDLHQIEAIAESNPWVGEAQAYIDNRRTLHIILSQRQPVVRIFETSGASYYIDTALKTVPLSDNYVHYAPIVTNVPELHNDSTGDAVKGQILFISQKIEKHPFWSAQITQISMNEEYEFEMIPVLGKHRILLGDTANLDNKLSNIFSFYKNVLNKIGWDKYDTLDVRYAGQVIAAPALKWKVPVDRALSNMNWVKAIIDNSSKEAEAANQGDLDIPVKASAEKARTPVEPKPKEKATQPKVDVDKKRPAATTPRNTQATH